MAYEILKLEAADGIGILTISRPQALNALNSAFFREMNGMLDDIGNRGDIKVLIITGDGPKSFVAGADIAEMVHMNSEEGYRFSITGHDVFNRIAGLPIPVLAAVNGFALGGGCELAMACDIRLASTNAKFGQPEVNLGLIPGYAGTQRLPRMVGVSNALWLLMTADIITADIALRMGLVQMVFEPDQLMNEAKSMAAKIISKGQAAVKLVKAVVRKGTDMDFASASEMEAREFGDLFGTTESGEGMKAFLEKRAPVWLN
jgi:enoyl-CoA hydratase